MSESLSVKIDVIIIGGGIGGLACAIALQQRGIAAHVFEAAGELRAVGAGLWVPCNAMQVLDRLGLAGAVAQSGAALRCAQIGDFQGGVLQSVDLEKVVRRYGFGTVAIHRARLQAALVAGLAAGTLHVGKQCQRITQDAEQVRVQFADGSAQAAPLLIAADGLRSPVRQQLFPNAQLRYSGQSSYRAVLHYQLPPEWLERGSEIWGRGCRFGFSRISADEVYWYATYNAPPNTRPSPAAAKAQLGALFADFPAPIPALVAATAEQQLTHTDIHDLRQLPAWHAGRVVLLGDAAHAATPNLGQGGAQAIEDAYVLAECLARDAAPDLAFAAYERTRRAKATMIVNRSWLLGKLAHLDNRLGRSARNLLIRSLPAAAGQQQFDQLFRLNY